MQNGNVLRKLRKEHNLTQKDIAQILQTSRQYYSDYECEKHELPLRHLITLADYFQVTTDYLLGLTPVSTFEPPTKKTPD